MHTSRYSLRNKRVNIAIPPNEYLKRNVQYQLLKFMSKFDEYLLQRAQTFNMKAFIQKKHILSINMRLTVYRKLLCVCTCININLIHFLFVCMDECICVFVSVFLVIFK